MVLAQGVEPNLGLRVPRRVADDSQEDSQRHNRHRALVDADGFISRILDLWRTVMDGSGR
jgi:hypothetical protein